MTDPGWIYVLANDTKPGQFKVGSTRIDCSTRAAQLTAHGYCLPWERPSCAWRVVYQVEFRHCEIAEFRAHRMLGDACPAWSREIFTCSLDRCIRSVNVVADYVGEGKELSPRPQPPYQWRQRHGRRRGMPLRSWLWLICSFAVIFVALIKPYGIHTFDW